MRVEDRTGKLEPLREKSLREKSQSLPRERRATQRRRMATQWEASRERGNGSDLTNRSPESEKYAAEEAMIEMSKEKMERFVRSLHRLEWAYEFLKQHPAAGEDSSELKEHMRSFRYDQDCPINEAAINYMIARRYQLLNYHLEDTYEANARHLHHQALASRRNHLAPPAHYRLLHSLSHHSILALIQGGEAREGRKGGKGG